MSDKWIHVKRPTFRNWKPLGKKSLRKLRKRGLQRRIPILTGCTKNVSYPTLMKTLNNEIREMYDSHLCRKLISELKRVVLEQRDIIHDCQKYAQFEPIHVNVICYGLGNFSISKASMRQLSLLIAVCQQLQTNTTQNINCKKEDVDNNVNNDHGRYQFSWEKARNLKLENAIKREKFLKCPLIVGSIQYYEPLLTNIEQKVLRNVSNVVFKVLENDSQGEYQIFGDRNGYSHMMYNYNEIYLFYMPHCPRMLYNNVIKSNINSNFSNDQMQIFWLLSRIFMIGNSFEQYANLAMGLRHAEKSQLNYILMCYELNIIREISISDWLMNDSSNSMQSNMNRKSIPKMKWKNSTKQRILRKQKKKNSVEGKKYSKSGKNISFNVNYNRDRAGISANAFAFQHLQYFPMKQIMNISKVEWRKMLKKLKIEDVQIK